MHDNKHNLNFNNFFISVKVVATKGNVQFSCASLLMIINLKIKRKKQN